jgi:hypothetical protein
MGATFRSERSVAGEEGPGDAGCEVGPEKGHGGMPSEMNALLEACEYRDGEHGADAARAGHAGRDKPRVRNA